MISVRAAVMSHGVVNKFLVDTTCLVVFCFGSAFVLLIPFGERSMDSTDQLLRFLFFVRQWSRELLTVTMSVPQPVKE